jgi:tRNA pseudouridine38-40 synthase
MKNLKMVLEYDGTAYHGWQRQAGMVTIQQVVEEKIGVMTREKVILIGSGRTDAGVHARCQVAHFRTGTRIPEGDLQRGLNSLLPKDIAVKEITEVPEDFHAQHSARSKAYEYKIFNGPTRPALFRNYSWFVYGALDGAAMGEAALMLKGVHDFSSFCAAGHESKSYIREIYDCGFEKTGKSLILFSIEANGFLKYMVRNIVGTLVEVGKGKRTPLDFLRIMEARDRRKAGVTAPPQGLYLVDVRYQ